ncbi:hypothetical protein Hypma_010691 [Hypsizygus marmoreus]|uniref:Uncharacterized protein n=1 Tax=Hypsizygus marmoreus TaxID=39966 RepID=A0A369JS61_HYPMA|nr:hypothetical protein Hypma_010691 [Hypsizygus marmoreus]
MTEYTTSSQAIREYMTSRERTAYWVQATAPHDFYSPSVPPTVLDGYVPSSPPSEAESSGSAPPRMVLRYGNGRPDVPIPSPEPSPTRSRRRHDGSDSSRSPTSPTFSQNSQHRPRAGSHGGSPLARSPPHRSDRHSERPAPLAPEEIRILPSFGNDQLPHSSSSSSSHQPRSKSLPRSGADLHSQPAPPLPGPMPPLQGPFPGQQVPFTPQPWHPYAQGRPPLAHKHPPAIVYAPSHSSSRPHYAPPAIYHHPPQMGPNGMIYSHSAPVQSQNRPYAAGIPSTMMPPSYPLSSVREEERRAGTWSGRSRSKRERDRARSLSLARPPRPTSSESSDSLDSQDSGSTYYVLPSAGQKVHIITPSPQASVRTATSTTRSPTSPTFSSFKKPAFFQRLFHFAGRLSTSGSHKAPSSSGGSGRRLQRRHSTGGTARRPVIDPVGHH